MRYLRSKHAAVLAFAFSAAACAGRDPHPVAVVQPQDAQSDCAMIRAEIEANNVQAEKLADENHAKVAQMSLPASSASSSGQCGSQWTQRALPEPKWMRSRRASNILLRWRSSDARDCRQRHPGHPSSK